MTRTQYRNLMKKKTVIHAIKGQQYLFQYCSIVLLITRHVKLCIEKNCATFLLLKTCKHLFVTQPLQYSPLCSSTPEIMPTSFINSMYTILISSDLHERVKSRGKFFLTIFFLPALYKDIFKILILGLSRHHHRK
jgi:hypothetical protein